MERIDLQIDVVPVSIKDISDAPAGESSEKIRKRVIAARQIQENRFKNCPGIHCNAQMTEKMLQQYATPTPEAAEQLRRAMERLQLSARVYSRILKVARDSTLEYAQEAPSAPLAASASPTVSTSSSNAGLSSGSPATGITGPAPYLPYRLHREWRIGDVVLEDSLISRIDIRNGSFRVERDSLGGASLACYRHLFSRFHRLVFQEEDGGEGSCPGDLVLIVYD